jgi:hypothetical protein
MDTSRPCRYDFLFVTPDVLVASIHYLYREVVGAPVTLSDHALVVADVEARSGKGLPAGAQGPATIEWE